MYLRPSTTLPTIKESMVFDAASSPWPSRSLPSLILMSERRFDIGDGLFDGMAGLDIGSGAGLVWILSGWRHGGFSTPFWFEVQKPSELEVQRTSGELT